MNTPNDTARLLALVNSSGFPFQLRIAYEIRHMTPGAGWDIISEEHAWKDETGNEGFIDLVVGCNTAYDRLRMIMECKRTRNADWVFLVPLNGAGLNGTSIRAPWIGVPDSALPSQVELGYYDFNIQPPSFISEFCVVRGTGEGQTPMLENLCRRLVSSAEGFARQETALSIATGRKLTRYYVPVIVTNARLQVCRFNMEAITVADGEIQTGECQEVPFVRFTKSLLTRNAMDPAARSVADLNRDRQRTVLVVNGSHLISLLRDWGGVGMPPWGSGWLES